MRLRLSKRKQKMLLRIARTHLKRAKKQYARALSEYGEAVSILKGV